MLSVGMDMMNGESAMSSKREKKQEGEKKSEKRNFELSSHMYTGWIKGVWEHGECRKGKGRENSR